MELHEIKRKYKEWEGAEDEEEAPAYVVECKVGQ